MQLRQRFLDRFNRGHALGEIGRDEMRHDFGVGFAGELRAVFFELRAKIAKILNDAIVNDCDRIGRVRMRVGFSRLAMSGPASVTDTGVAGERRRLQNGFEIF